MIDSFKYLFFVFTAIMILGSCRQNTSTVQSEISGRFDKYPGQRLYLKELEPQNSVLIDSVTISPDGDYTFSFAMDEAGIYLLQAQKGNIIVLQLEKGEAVKLNSSEEIFTNGYRVKGSPGSELIRDFEMFMNIQKERLDSLSGIYNNSRGKEDFLELKEKLDLLYDEYVQEQRNYVLGFIDNHGGTLVALLVLNRKLGTMSVIDELEDFEYLHRVDSMLQVNYPGNKHTLDHHKRVQEIKGRLFDHYVIEEKLRAGKRAPDIIMNDSAGIPFSLKSLQGKKVLVYFWAGWDARSRQTNRKLQTIYPDLKTRNIELLTVSLDENRVVWTAALRLDNLPGTHISELKGFYSDIKKKYNVPDELPYFYFLDEDHTILGKGSDLEKMESYFK